MGLSLASVTGAIANTVVRVAKSAISLVSPPSPAEVRAQSIPITPTVGGNVLSYNSVPPKIFNPKGNQNNQSIVTGYDPKEIKFNLPPHKWSLPINQNFMNDSEATTTNHGLRRSRMWCYAFDDTSNSAREDADRRLLARSTNIVAAPLDTKWGFQFLWNPEAIGTGLSRNVAFTPTTSDRFANLYGLFTAMESISFKITINRVNDFAAIKGLLSQAGSNGQSPNALYSSIINDYYSGTGFPSNNLENPVDQLKDLMELGTMADIEYIYKMINGEGSDGKTRTNALGKKTADMGFLSPTAIAIQFGPTVNNLSYVGYVNGLNIAHTLFTEDMIPIHSEITVDFVAYARTYMGTHRRYNDAL